MRKTLPILLALALASTARADGFLSKSYEFKANTPLQVGVDLGDGVRFDSIEFVLPKSGGEGPTPLFEQPKAKVTISNLGDAAVKVGIAIAVVDGLACLLIIVAGSMAGQWLGVPAEARSRRPLAGDLGL